MIGNTVLEKLEYPKVLKSISSYALTENGKQDILNLTPLTDINLIIKEGKIVNEAKEILIKNQPPPIDYIPDLSETITQSRIEGSTLNSKKILEILKLVKVSRNVQNFLKQQISIAPELSEQIGNLFSDKVFEHHIEKVIDETGEIKEKASQKLADIRKQIRDKQTSLVKSINSI